MTELQTLITTSYSELLPDAAAITNAINTTRTRVGSVSRAIFSMWCGRTGLRAAIEDHARNTESPLRSIAITLEDFLRGGSTDAVDFAHPDNIYMLNVWEQAGAITNEQVQEIIALATEPDPVSENDVKRAIWADDGTRLI